MSKIYMSICSCALCTVNTSKNSSLAETRTDCTIVGATRWQHSLLKITQILQSLHWLPIKFRISYKILLLAYKALNDLAPAYLTNLLSRNDPTRSLRSQNSGLLVRPRILNSTKGGRTFSYLAPKLWKPS